ncbi:putative serine/threonine-protein kinase [Lentisphaera araneosa HTCC2155]|uniref:Putative serine/threonine-protein kinase n=1 Tax=Lentisphaera araneosa HTCC2155 TaxID=313628 RepID=A6DFT7_9BACT|nr:serine/threonine-protein kinase [Lentisphaera araneosa]EDM29667.1 putative serine/threonine-protein kinase [Lentisphaera araneosa HTCC2155]
MNQEEYFQQLESTSTALFDVALGRDSKEDRYTEMNEVGRGATKHIYKVLDLSSGRTVALALPNEDLSKEQVHGFLEEARLTASLQHPNIIQVYNLGYRQDGKPFFTMKLCSDKKLSHMLADSANSLFDLMGIFLKVCEAVSYAHSMGAIHRDIKDDNILLGDFGEVLLCDWGSAQILKDSILEQEVGQLMNPISLGTNGFMSPEQTQGGEASECQDIYSLGALLYKILTKEEPSATARPPREVDPTIPLSLEAICLKAKATNSKDRYLNCEELITDIKAYLSGFAPQAEGASLNKHVWLFLVRHKSLTLFTLFSFILITCLSLYYIVSLKEKEAQTSIERDRAENALELYDIEKSSRKKIAALGADYFFQQAAQLISAHSSQLAIELLESIPTKSLSKKQVKKKNMLYGRIHFYRQQFNQALEYFNKGEVYKDNELIRIAKYFVNKKSNDSERLNSTDIVKILDQLYQIEIHQAHCFFREQVLAITDYEGQIPIIQKMIKLNNKIDDVDIKFEIINGKHHMDLSHNKNMRRWEPVREMKLNHLNLSHSPIRIHFHVLKGMPLESLNIAFTKVKNFDFLYTLPNLKELIIDKSMIKGSNLNEILDELKDQAIQLSIKES